MMRKSIIMVEMANPAFAHHYKKLRIKLRKNDKAIPYFGTVKNTIGKYHYRFKHNQEAVLFSIILLSV